MPSNRTKYALEFRDQTAKHIVETGILSQGFGPISRVLNWSPAYNALLLMYGERLNRR